MDKVYIVQYQEPCMVPQGQVAFLEEGLAEIYLDLVSNGSNKDWPNGSFWRITSLEIHINLVELILGK